MEEELSTTEDRCELSRFLRAQAGVFEQALSEIRAGDKRSHWMWFIFPQLAGLGSSEYAVRYAIRSIDEARAYIEHPILGPRLKECAQACLDVKGRSAHEIFGYPDDLKLHSSMSLFAIASQPGSVFHSVLDRYFEGNPDSKTLDLLGERPDGRD